MHSVSSQAYQLHSSSIYINRYKKATTTSNTKQILQSHPLYTAIQTWKIIKKKGKSVKCSNHGCKKELQIDTICLQVEGAIEIAWEKSCAEPRDFFYFHPSVNCAKSAPRWTNIRYPQNILVDSDVDSSVVANILQSSPANSTSQGERNSCRVSGARAITRSMKKINFNCFISKVIKICN